MDKKRKKELIKVAVKSKALEKFSNILYDKAVVALRESMKESKKAEGEEEEDELQD